MKTVWILGDQLTLENAALAGCDPRDTCVLMIESVARGRQRRYHQQKLVLVFSAMRHFAAGLVQAGWRVDYHRLESTPSFLDGLSRHVGLVKPSHIRILEPNDWTMQEALPQMATEIGTPIELVPNNLFLLGRDEFRVWAGGSRRILMEHHYRRVRQRFDILMNPDGTPIGGEWNLDAENRKTVSEWRRAGCPRPVAITPEIPDSVTSEVIRLVAERFDDHPGKAEKFWLPTTRRGALQWLERFVAERLPGFGPYEDLMLEGEPMLFHSVLTPMLNLGLLRPLECVRSVVAAYESGRIPLGSAEGFVRQIMGWREFVHGVYWLKGPQYVELNGLNAQRPLPGWFYTGETPMNCMRACLRQVIDSGYNHHIQRLMILGNFLLLSGVNPKQALGWFSEMYLDAHDWVMAANVIGMALHADGGFMATKPYAAAAAYVNRMSDYCSGCRYKAGVRTGPDACPFNLLYWDFFARNEKRFAANPRVSMAVQTWRKRPEGEKALVRREALEFLDGMG